MAESDSLTVLRSAIQMEFEGKDFFERAAVRMTNQKAKDMFLGLVKQEERHVDILSREFERLSEGKSWISVNEVQKEVGSGPRLSVFRDKQIRRIKLRHSAGELEVLGLGMEVEKKSIEYYKNAGASVKDPKAEGVFKWLVGEETGHLTILTAEFDYRSRSGYYYDKAEFSLEVE